MLQVGNTFLLPKNDNKTEHLWIVITTPDENGKAVCVNISSLRAAFCDKTVIITPGEHPFIVKDSVVRYADAGVLDLKEVHKALEANNYNIVCVLKAPCSPILLRKIQDGLLKSQHASKDIQDKCRKSWGRSLTQ